MEICPKCRDYTLSYDPARRVAICYSKKCNYCQPINDYKDYFKSFIISKLNWENYCAKTPSSIRKLRGTMAPLTGT